MLGVLCRRLVFGKMGGGTPPGATRPNLPGAAADAFSSAIANAGPARVSAGDLKNGEKSKAAFPSSALPGGAYCLQPPTRVSPREHLALSVSECAGVRVGMRG